MYVKTGETGLNVDNEGYALQHSFASDPAMVTLPNSAWKEMAENWIEIEDDKDVIAEEVSEVVEALEANMESVSGAGDDADDEDDPAAASATVGGQGGETIELDVEPITKQQAMAYMDVLMQYCRQENFDEEVTGLSQIESSMRRKRMKKATVNPTITSFFFKASK
mmetsp:Transcript_23983/g.34886  ORF Transcript_23983/g.34886 Transcript_23983/m.34886 type:complete len:166 (+) Transcript_23983:338-835(+)